MKMEGWKALAKQIVDQQLAKDFARDMVDICGRVEGLENLPVVVQSKWRALSQELENDHKAEDFVFILIKIKTIHFCSIEVQHDFHASGIKY